MEIRKSNAGGEIQQTDLGIRKAASRAVLAGHYGKHAVTGLGAGAAGITKWAAKGSLHVTKNRRRTKAFRTQLKLLTREQRKQWNSYSYRKQTRILEQAQRITVKKYGRNAPVSLQTKELQEELHSRAYGYQKNGMTMSDRWEVSIPKGKTAAEMKKNWNAGNTETKVFYTDSLNRGKRKVKAIEKTYPKRVKKEKQRDRAIFMSSVLSVLDREGKKLKQIKQLQAQDQISQMELENRGVSAMTGYISAPVKVKVQAAVGKVVQELAEKTGKFLLKLLLPVLLPLLFVLMIVVAVLSAAGGSTESGSGAASIGGGGYSATGEQIAEYAWQWIGTPYVWGGTDLNTAVDCSGFTYCVYAQFDIALPRTAFEQGNTEQGQLVDTLAQALPGDLIWWTPRHVGVYIGNGQAVQSSGDETNYDLAHAGKGVCIVQADYRTIGSIRRFVTDVTGTGGTGTGGHSVDPVAYTKEQLELIWAVVAQEDCGSYEGSLAVISSAMNRTESPAWSRYGNNAYAQLTAPGQYCYSAEVGGDWRMRLNGNVPAFTKQAVNDCLVNGIRNHAFTCFRSTNGGDPKRVQVGGNWYFN